MEMNRIFMVSGPEGSRDLETVGFVKACQLNGNSSTVPKVRLGLQEKSEAKLTP